MKITTHTLNTVVSFGTMALLLWVSTFWALPANAQSAQPSSAPKPEIRDFAGRLIPKAAHELMGMAKPPEVVGKVPAKVPGWEPYSGLDRTARYEFKGEQERLLSLGNLWVSIHRRNNDLVGEIRRMNPDKSWEILDLFAISKSEAVTVQCNPIDHPMPENHVLVGILREGDKRFKPSPPAPTDGEMAEFFQRTRKYPPRSCMGDIQKARIAAFLDLKTGRLQKYSEHPVYCISPYYNPCPP